MDKFLIELLLSNNSVILPDFGAIVIANESTGEVMFNEYLKFNDGKLIALIVANSSMEEQDATNMVAKYVRDIQIQLDKGESYDIFGLGSFLKDKDGSTIFNGNVNASTKKEAEEIAGPSPTPKAEPKKEKKETPIKKEEKEEKDLPEIDLTAPMESAEEKPKAETPVEKPKKVVKKEEKPKKIKAPKEKKEKKKRGVFFWIIIFLLVVITGGGVFVGLKYEEVKAYMGWDKFESVETVAQLDDTVPTDETENEDANSESDDATVNEINESETMEENDLAEVPEENEVVEETTVEEEPAPEIVPTETVNTDGKTFHLIAGSFSDVSNAEKLVAELKSKGMPAHIVGQFNGLHMVSVKSYSTRSEAMGEITSIQNEAPGAWLLKHPK